MTILNVNPKHTSLGKIDTMASITHKGMAHFAATGPRGKTCRECSFVQVSGYYVISGSHRGSLKPGPCHKRASLMQGVKGEAVPHEARACKYFELNERALPPKEPGALP